MNKPEKDPVISNQKSAKGTEPHGSISPSEPTSSPLATDSLSPGPSSDYRLLISEPYKFARVRARILEAASYLASQKQAAQVAGIHPRTLRRWLKEGKDQYSVISSQAEAAGQDTASGLLTTAPLAQFYMEYEEVSAQAAIRVLRNVVEASKNPKYWKAGMALLSRRYPEQWNKRPDTRAVKQTFEYTIIDQTRDR